MLSLCTSVNGVVKQMYDGCLPEGQNAFVAATAAVQCPCFVSFALSNAEQRPDARVDFLVLTADKYEAWSRNGKVGTPEHVQEASRTSAVARYFDASANDGRGAYIFSGLEHEMNEEGEFVLVLRASGVQAKDCVTNIGYVFEPKPEPCPEQLSRILSLDLRPMPVRRITTTDGHVQKIVAGTKASEFPDRSYLAFVSTGTGDCSGSIIASSWVLTAAHCVDTSESSSVSVYVTGTNTRDGVVHSARQLFRHPKFQASDKVAGFDVALIELEKPIESSTNFCAVALNSDTDGPSPKTFVRATGYGSVSEAWIGGASRNLHRVDLPVISTADCISALGGDAVDLSGQVHLCAGHTDSACDGDTCLGDSGGPVVVRNEDGFVQVAMTTGGIGCARGGVPGVYTRIGGVLEWIETVVGENVIKRVRVEGQDPSIGDKATDHSGSSPVQNDNGVGKSGTLIAGVVGGIGIVGICAAVAALILFRRRWKNENVEAGLLKGRTSSNAESNFANSTSTTSTSTASSSQTTSSTESNQSGANAGAVTTDFFGRRADGMFAIMR